MSKEIQPICSNDDCRQKFKDCGLTYNDITEGDILILMIMLQTELKKSNKAGETSVNTMRLSDKRVIKRKANGSITECYLYMNSHYFTQRECISFSKDGFIYFCGWADTGNANPVKRAFLDWCDVMAKMKKEVQG